MTGLEAFLPSHLVRALARGIPRAPRAEKVHAALLLSDISGFTALTEKLQAKGRQGAEEVAVAVNAVFGPAIDAIERQGGGIVRFRGDDMFALFPGASAVRRARPAAGAL